LPRRQLINNHLAVLCYEVLHRFLSVQTLNNCNINAPRTVLLSAANVSDGFRRHAQEHPEAFLPLIEWLPPVNDNQGVDSAFRDEPRRYCRFSECRWSSEDALVMRGNFLGCFLLERTEFPLEFDFNCPRTARPECRA
jgi:hypothetical protein